jgi:hypothetical protein
MVCSREVGTAGWSCFTTPRLCASASGKRPPGDRRNESRRAAVTSRVIAAVPRAECVRARGDALDGAALLASGAET